MAQLPKFTPPVTEKANYDQNIVNWAYIQLQYGKPKGPNQKNYGPYYSYLIDVNINGQAVKHRWFPNVDEHKLIQMAGAANQAQMAVTYVKDGNRKGLVVVHTGGPRTDRQQGVVDAETEAELLAMNGGGTAIQRGMPQVVLPPQPPQFPAPGTPPTPPGQQPPPQQQQVVVPPAQPPPQPQPEPPQQPQKPPQQQRQAPPPEVPEQRVYYPRFRGDNVEDNLALFSAISADAVELRYMAFLDTEVRFADKLPDIPKVTSKTTVPQKIEIARLELERTRLIVELSAAPNMTLSKETYHKLEKNGVTWVLGKRPDPPLEPTTRENARALVGDLHPDQYAGNPKTLIVDWLKYVAGPHEHIKSWKHAGNICNLLGLDTDVLISEFDVEHMLLLTNALWAYEDHRQDSKSQDDALKQVSEDFGLPIELMKLEEKDE